MPTRSEQTIGQSTQGRPLRLSLAGPENAETRVFVLAGQHGDEALAPKAVSTFLQGEMPRGVQVAALVNANPDGAAQNQRKSAKGIDLNRDHQKLRAAETRAVHHFARQWRPHLIIDVHTYPPRRKHLLTRKLVHAADAYIDVTNNPTALAGMDWAEALYAALPNWIAAVRKRGYRSDRYTIITKDNRVRHSTPDITDARNGLALACGVPTVLLEGREPTRLDSVQASNRTHTALLLALRSVAQSAPSLREHVRFKPLGELHLPIRSRYAASAARRQLEMFDAAHRNVQRVMLDGKYLPQLEITRFAAPPESYIVPQASKALIALLERHGVQGQPWNNTDRGQVIISVVEKFQPPAAPRRAPRNLVVRPMLYTGSRDDYVQFRVTPENARLLTAFLDPHSKYGLVRYPQLGLAPRVGFPIPVLCVHRPEQAGVAVHS